MTDRTKSAKKGWHTRRVKSKYKEICDKMERDPDILATLKKHKKLFAEVQSSAREMIGMRFRYEDLLVKVSHAGNIMENLPIESLKDYADFEKHGRPTKGRFSDVIEAGDIRRSAMQMQDEKQNLAQEAYMAQIDLAEAACKALIRLLDNEDEVSCDNSGPTVGVERQTPDGPDKA